MSPIDWAMRPLKKYADFSGRAPRAELWWYMLFIIIVGTISLIFAPIAVLFYLATFIPSLAVQIRRLHDIDRSGWWFLIAFVPLVGGIILLVFFVTQGTTGPNQFGEDPYAAAGGGVESTATV